AAPAAHHHPHEQWTLVEKGPVLFQVGGEERRLETGAMIYIPSDVMHGARSLGSGAVLVDVFSPIREDFLQ
ncbi:MAG: cupin domain-containing protein, partial [Acidobacteria bacterium]|nr:cupin domain-containing protein [Acidobacteriota bacterium]